MEGQRSDICLVPFEFILGRLPQQIQIVGVCGLVMLFIGQGGDILLESLVLFLQSGYFLLEGEYGLPLFFEVIALGVHIAHAHSDLLPELQRALPVLVFYQVLQDVLVQLLLLLARQHHSLDSNNIILAHHSHNQLVLLSSVLSTKPIICQKYPAESSKVIMALLAHTLSTVSILILSLLTQCCDLLIDHTHNSFLISGYYARMLFLQSSSSQQNTKSQTYKPNLPPYNFKTPIYAFENNKGKEKVNRLSYKQAIVSQAWLCLLSSENVLLAAMPFDPSSLISLCYNPISFSITIRVSITVPKILSGAGSIQDRLLCEYQTAPLAYSYFNSPHLLFIHNLYRMQSFHTQPETREWGELVNPPLSQLPQSSCSFSPFPQPSPPSPQIALIQLSRAQKQLETTIEEARIEQDMMMELFEKMARLEKGEQEKLKKCRRRCPEEIAQRYSCPHQHCTRFYASDSALKRHVRLKHDELGDDPPERYHTLHPEPDLYSQQYFNGEESPDEQTPKDKKCKGEKHLSIQVKCK